MLVGHVIVDLDAESNALSEETQPCSFEVALVGLSPWQPPA
jgi:hypothetical protein